MEVIKRGLTILERNWRGGCGSCGSVMIAKGSELTNRALSARGWWFGYALCPVCEQYEVRFELLTPEEDERRRKLIPR